MLRAILTVLPRPALVLLALLAHPAVAAAQSQELSLTSIVPSPTQVTVGSTVTVSGVSMSSAFTGNVQLGLALRVPPMGASLPLPNRQIFVTNGQINFSTTFVVPSLASPGVYQVIGTIDATNVVVEIDETNNSLVGAQTIEVVAADLRASDLTGAGTGLGGLPYAIELEIENLSPVDANGFVYSYYFGATPSGTPLFTSPPISLAANAATVRMDTIPLPATPGPATITAVVNGNLLVPETTLSNNLRRLNITIEVPRPDLQATIAPITGSVELGQTLAVAGNIQNFGRAAAPATTWAVMLSFDPLVTGADIELGRYTLPRPLPNGDFEPVMETVRIPTDVMPGNYYLGLLADPAEAIPEEDEGNNGSMGRLIQVFEPELLITTEALPDGAVGQAYAFALAVQGGAFPPDWTLVGGPLPAGLSLSSSQGILQGRPTEAGVFPLTIRATSGGAIAEADFTLTILEGEGAPAVETTSLPAGLVGTPYAQPLLARGGLPPYTWTASDPLPAGLMLTSEGLLEGTPTAAGEARFTVVVRDSANQTGAADLSLAIRAAGSAPAIGTEPLPEAVVGEAYCGAGPVRVAVSGGRAPYRWSAIDPPPAGLTLAEDGALCGTPGVAGDFSFVVRVTDADGFFDTARLTIAVRAAGEITVTPDTLPDAVLGQAYQASLTASGGTPPFTFEANAAELPPGIALSTDGAFSGTPTAEGAFAFVVTARDASGATRPKPLSIRVRAPGGVTLTPGLEGSSGCRGGASAAGAWIALIGLLGILRRPRAL